MTAHLRVRSIPASAVVDSRGEGGENNASPPAAASAGCLPGVKEGVNGGGWAPRVVWHDACGDHENGDAGGVVLYPTAGAASAQVRIPHASMSKVEAFYTIDPSTVRSYSC
jgi:hypothetical protein